MTPITESLTTKPLERLRKRITTMLNHFESNVYSEELFPVSESEHDEVMQMMASDNDGWQDYGEWSAALDQHDESENFVVVNGKVSHKPEPPSLGRVNGYEL
jgi:hypothetical protein